VLERVDDVPLLILPQVINPVVLRTGELLARTIAESSFADPPATDTTPLALDMGTGSGIAAIFAARRGYRVIGVDINPEAVRCARINLLLNDVEDRVEIKEGDLFDAVRGSTFHLVTFNPPFLRGRPTSLYDAGWRSTDVLERFAAGLPTILAPDGRALVLLSTDGDEQGMLGALKAQHLLVAPVFRRDLGNELVTVYGVQRSSGGISQTDA
jgi:release factor glutamine methyltransferase